MFYFSQQLHLWTWESSEKHLALRDLEDDIINYLKHGFNSIPLLSWTPDDFGLRWREMSLNLLRPNALNYVSVLGLFFFFSPQVWNTCIPALSVTAMKYSSTRSLCNFFHVSCHRCSRWRRAAGGCETQEHLLRLPAVAMVTEVWGTSSEPSEVLGWFSFFQQVNWMSF